MNQCSAPVFDKSLNGYRRCLKRADNVSARYEYVPLCDAHEKRATRHRDAVIYDQQAHIEKLKAKVKKFELAYEMEKQEQVDAKRKRYLESMYVYFIRCGNYIKIGASESPLGRLSTIKKTGGVVSPRGLDLSKSKLVGTMPGDFKIERKMHDRFSHLRDVGEWFHAEPELLSFIEKLEGAAA